MDELIGIDYCKITVDASVIGDAVEPPKLPNFPGMDASGNVLGPGKSPSPQPAPASTTPQYQPGDKVTKSVSQRVYDVIVGVLYLSY